MFNSHAVKKCSKVRNDVYGLCTCAISQEKVITIIHIKDNDETMEYNLSTKDDCFPSGLSHHLFLIHG